MTTKKRTSHRPGDIVRLAGIEFVVLDNNMAGSSSDEEVLLILATKSQGDSRFGDNNNYAESDLLKAVRDWLNELEGKGVDIYKLRSRRLDLTTLDGYKGYGTMEVHAAPLTIDEARKYAEVIPNCDDLTWLVTGWGGPGHLGESNVLVVYSNGDWYSFAHSSRGIRPALVLPSSLLDSESDETGLEDVSTEDLLEDIRRRVNGGKE